MHLSELENIQKTNPVITKVQAMWCQISNMLPIADNA